MFRVSVLTTRESHSWRARRSYCLASVKKRAEWVSTQRGDVHLKFILPSLVSVPPSSDPPRIFNWIFHFAAFSQFVCLLAVVAVCNAGIANYNGASIIAPTYTSESQNVLRSHGNLQQVSYQSKTIDTPYSSVSKSDVRVSNPGIQVAQLHQPLAYGKLLYKQSFAYKVQILFCVLSRSLLPTCCHPPCPANRLR